MILMDRKQFCHVMLRISAEICRRAVSGWLVSVTFVYCVETAKYTAKYTTIVAMESIGNRTQAF